MPIFTEKLDFGAIFDFRDFQKGTFWTTFSRAKSPKCYPGSVRGSVLGPTFSEHRFFFFFDRLLAHFFNIKKIGAFGSILAAFGSLLVSFWLHVGPCWSIWLHFDALKPTLRPTTPKKQFLFICFDSFRFWIVFKWISADLCIDLGIVFQPNLYHLSPFVFILNPQPHNPNPTTPHTHKHKNMARRNARSRAWPCWLGLAWPSLG